MIRAIEAAPLAELRYLNASARGGTEVARLPLLRGAATWSAPDLDAIVACSDLQGMVGDRHGSVLLGVAVAGWLAELADDGALPRGARTGVILAGDLYSVPTADQRGGRGDVADVWAAFAEHFAWVVGVAGNHDDVRAVPALGERVHLLDGDVVEVDGLRIGGVGGVIGSSHKPMRRDEAAFLAALDRTIDRGVDVVVLHEGPDGEDDGPGVHQRGHAGIRATLEAGGVPLAICGHTHWSPPLATLGPLQILNVDARVVVLVR